MSFWLLHNLGKGDDGVALGCKRSDVVECQTLFRLGVKTQRAHTAHDVFRKGADLGIGANQPHQVFLGDVPAPVAQHRLQS